MAKYHINPDKGPMRCSAREGRCPYGEDAPHFNDKEEAQKEFEKQLSKENDPLVPHRKKDNSDKKHSIYMKNKSFNSELSKLDDDLSLSNYDSIVEYANESKENYRKLDELIDARSTYARYKYDALENINPKNKNSVNKISVKNFNLLKKEFDSYRNQTAIMVEAHINSENYKSNVIELGNDDLGKASPITNYDHDDPLWHTSRYNTIGGSDIGALAIKDFVPEEEQNSLDKYGIRRVVDSKMIKPTLEDSLRDYSITDDTRKGAIYRGTVWEDRIRDDFAKDRPEYTVYETKQQYKSSKYDWQRVNFDGIISNRPDKKPNGILEVKTGGVPERWDNGVPNNYRAQVLYYLNATGYEYAEVRVLLNDGESRDYRLNSTDEVIPGCGMNMSQYLEEKIGPWWQEIKSTREN